MRCNVAWSFVGGLLLVTGALGTSHAAEPGLKDVFAGDFRVGAALPTDQVMGQEPQAAELAKEQFNSATPENLLKWEAVHPELDRYNFEPADKYVEFGEKNGMFLVGHTLVWHNQTPAWVFQDAEGKPLTRDALIERMRDHIHTVVGRYKGKIKGWDVVNEAILENGTRRQTKWQEIIGDDYLEKAYQFAHEADPDAELYYNEYHEWYPKTREGIKKLITDLKAKGVPVHGLGLQGHWGINSPTVEQIDEMLTDYGQLGIPIKITELDIKLQAPESAGDGKQIEGSADRYLKGAPELPAELQQKLTDRYAEIFRVLLKHKDKIDRVTFWGVHDGQSWHNYFPRVTRPAYPLLFDRNCQPKPAFFAVIKEKESEEK